MQPITRINANDPVIFSEMNLRFNEIEARDNEQQEQINVLNNNARFKTFLSLEEIGADITTPILDIGKLMPDLSKLYAGITASDASIYPDVQGVLMITRLNEWRAVCEFHSQWNGNMWLGGIIIGSNTWTGWYEIPTTVQTQAMIDALNA